MLYNNVELENNVIVRKYAQCLVMLWSHFASAKYLYRLVWYLIDQGKTVGCIVSC